MLYFIHWPVVRTLVQIAKFPYYGIDPLTDHWIPLFSHLRFLHSSPGNDNLTQKAKRHDKKGFRTQSPYTTDVFMGYLRHDLMQPFAHSTRKVFKNVISTGRQCLTLAIIIYFHRLVAIETVIGKFLVTHTFVAKEVTVWLPTVQVGISREWEGGRRKRTGACESQWHKSHRERGCRFLWCRCTHVSFMFEQTLLRMSLFSVHSLKSDDKTG